MRTFTVCRLIKLFELAIPSSVCAHEHALLQREECDGSAAHNVPVSLDPHCICELVFVELIGLPWRKEEEFTAPLSVGASNRALCNCQECVWPQLEIVRPRFDLNAIKVLLMKLICVSGRQQLIFSRGLLIGTTHFTILHRGEGDRPNLEAFKFSFLELNIFVVFLVQQIWRSRMEDAVGTTCPFVSTSQVALFDVQNGDWTKADHIAFKLFHYDLSIGRVRKHVSPLTDKHKVTVSSSTISTAYTESARHMVFRNHEEGFDANLALHQSWIIDWNIIQPLFFVRHEHVPSRRLQHVPLCANVVTKVARWDRANLLHVVDSKGYCGIGQRSAPGPFITSIWIIVHSLQKFVVVLHEVAVISWEVTPQVVEKVVSFHVHFHMIEGSDQIGFDGNCLLDGQAQACNCSWQRR
mmetsp:Transcript_84496/g.149556  ORF Transcript_84496/g.149556 Transcript_84496/m.149556 type:complete len:410 (-) Transcript_84496:126-1355(-)